MKHFILLIIVSAVFAAACSPAREPDFTLSGRVMNYRGGKLTLYREDNLNRKESSEIGTIPIKADGSFSMGFNNEPHLYRLNFFGRKTIDLAIDHGQNIVIEADAADLASIKVSGSEDTAKLEAYEKFRKESLDRLVVSIRDRIAAITDARDPSAQAELARLGDLEIVNYDRHKDELIDFVQKTMPDSIAAYATTIRWDGGHNLPVLESIVQSFASKHPGLAVTKRIQEKLELIKSNTVGGTVADISMPDSSGRQIKLSSIKAKFILIDFWASWCPPCRRESPDLVELYGKYKSRGFEIYGVSLDSERSLWLNAIGTDKRTWPNVSTLQEYETPAAFDYSITALPANFLIDSERKVIARNLRTHELRAKLESLFGS